MLKATPTPSGEALPRETKPQARREAVPTPPSAKPAGSMREGHDDVQMRVGVRAMAGGNTRKVQRAVKSNAGCADMPLCLLLEGSGSLRFIADVLPVDLKTYAAGVELS